MKKVHNGAHQNNKLSALILAYSFDKIINFIYSKISMDS